MLDAFFATPASFGKIVNLTGASIRKYVADGRIPHTRVLGRIYLFLPGAEEMLWSSLH